MHKIVRKSPFSLIHNLPSTFNFKLQLEKWQGALHLLYVAAQWITASKVSTTLMEILVLHWTSGADPEFFSGGGGGGGGLLGLLGLEGPTN